MDLRERFDLPETLRTFSLTLVLLAAFLTSASRSDEPVSAISVPKRFHVELYADDDLAHDIHSLTIDSYGRVVVSGPGYVRILVDEDKDGRAESFIDFCDRPATGSQGMFFMGPHLVCSGDEGLQIFRDDNNDDTADGDPEVFLRIPAGGEHHVHSIQKGPDGWWYVIAGNMSNVTGSYATLPTSPLKYPESGTVLRLAPDLSGGEVIADGFRNAYDFAFSVAGDMFTFDSDGERDVSLPWYEPTRVFQIVPKAHAGWISRSWKRPDAFPDMPPVIGRFDRGSPTGVVCYRHDQFPGLYHGAIFVLDWTFGRILALPLAEDGAGWKSTPIEFATATGQFGFAPTDVEVGRDGSLFVSVGGRGTRGGVYRISYESGITAGSPDRSDKLSSPLNTVLTAPQPGSSWSRKAWIPAANKLGANAFRDAALDEGRRADERVRAIEILTELFKGLDAQTAVTLTASASPDVRARAAWALGRTNPSQPDSTVLTRFLADSHPRVVRAALEALTTVVQSETLDSVLPRIAVALASSDHRVRFAASRLIDQLTPQQRETLRKLLAENQQAQMWMSLGSHARSGRIDIDAVNHAAAILADDQHSPALRLTAARTIQLSLGDVGPVQNRPAVFDSYAPATSLAAADLALNPVRIELARMFPTKNPLLDHEIIRLIAMLAPLNRELINPLLDGITETSTPSDDIHRLIALARIAVDRTYEQSVATAQAIVNLDVKIHEQNLKQDSNWDDRIGELYAAICDVDPAIRQVIVEQPGFGLPGHVLLLSQVGQDAVPAAIDRFVSRIEQDEAYAWSNDVVFVIGESTKPEHQELIRKQLDNLSVHDAVLMVLAENPARSDRDLFVHGLESAQLNAVEASLKALKQMPRNNSPAEQFILLSAARRLINDPREFELRELAMRLLQNNLAQSFGFQFGKDGHKPQPEAMHGWEAYLRKRFADFQPADAGGDVANRILDQLPGVDWESGDVSRGKTLFAKLACARCHGGRKALGPDLQGVAQRFSQTDLFAAIVDPDRDVSPRYQTTSIETKAGRVYTGLIVYDSVDGLLLRDADHKTFRIEDHEIELRVKRRGSLMPAGLLNDVTDQNIADLNAYLRSL